MFKYVPVPRMAGLKCDVATTGFLSVNRGRFHSRRSDSERQMTQIYHFSTIVHCDTFKSSESRFNPEIELIS